MNNPLLSIALLDILRWRRMPLAIAAALIPPIGMAYFLVALTLAVGRQPVALVVVSHGQDAQQMEKIIENDNEAYVATITDKDTAAKMLQSQKVAGIITIPENFDTAILNQQATVNLTLNNIDIDFGDDIRRIVDRSVAEFDAPQLSLAGEKGELTGINDTANPYHVVIQEHDLRETNVGFLNYQVLPVLILLVLSIGLIGTALLCAQDGESGMVKHLLLAPVPAWMVIGGRLLGGLIISLAVLLPVLVICTLAHVVSPPANHWPALIVLITATALCASGLGAVLGSLLHGSRVVAMAASVLATYLFFLGGGFTTIAFLPNWLQVVSSFVPTRYAIDGMRQILFYPDLIGVQHDLTVLIGAALGSVILGSFALRRSWRM